MISSFRRYLETWYVRAFFLVMVASFVLWGVGDMLRGIGTSTWVAQVGDTTIEAQTMENDFRQALSAATRDLPPGQEPSAELRRAVGDQTLQRLIGNAAMSQELRKLGVVVPEQALVQTARSMPAFKGQDGNFDKARFDQLLRANNMTEASFLNLLRGDIARQQLMDAISAGATVAESEAAPIYAAEYEKRSADMAVFPFASTPEPPAPDEAAVQRWYDNHPDKYATPEYRRVKVIVISTSTMAPEITITDKDVQAGYAEHQSEYTTIAKRSAQVVSSTKEETAKALADQWRAGADWATIEAAAKSAGAAAIVQDDATETQFPDPDLAKAVFSAAPDTVSSPIKGALGWFVIRVTKAVEGGVEPFDAVKDKLRERLITEKALGMVYDEANKLDGLIGNGTPLDGIPPDPGVAAGTVTLDQSGDTPEGAPAALPGGAEIHAAIAAAAFETQKGDPPHLTEVQTPSTGGSGYYAMTVEDVIPAGEKPFAAVRDEVVKDWQADQRRHSAEQAAAAMLKQLKDGKNFSDAARDAGVTPNLSPLVMRTQRDSPIPRELQPILFTLKKGEPTMVETAEGFLVATPVEIVAPEPSADTAGYEQLRTAVTRTVANDLANLFVGALRTRANPRINQANIDQIVQP